MRCGSSRWCRARLLPGGGAVVLVLYGSGPAPQPGPVTGCFLAVGAGETCFGKPDGAPRVPPARGGPGESWPPAWPRRRYVSLAPLRVPRSPSPGPTPGGDRGPPLSTGDLPALTGSSRPGLFVRSQHLPQWGVLTAALLGALAGGLVATPWGLRGPLLAPASPIWPYLLPRPPAGPRPDPRPGPGVVRRALAIAARPSAPPAAMTNHHERTTFPPAPRLRSQPHPTRSHDGTSSIDTHVKITRYPATTCSRTSRTCGDRLEENTDTRRRPLSSLGRVCRPAGD